MNFEKLDPRRAQTVNGPYLDILEAAFLLRRPPCQIRCLAETGLIPAHVLKHHSQTCWKFRVSELLRWATDMNVEIGAKALWGFLSRGNRPR